MIYKVIDDGSEDVVNAWYPAFCLGLNFMDWTSFTEKLFPKVLKLARLESTYCSRLAACNIMTAASIIAAEKKCFEKLLLHPYMELCQDSDVVIRKTALGNLKLIIQKVEPSEVERMFFAELMVHLPDPNPYIRYIIMDVIITHERLFSTMILGKEFVPVLIKEFENGWKDTDCWLLNNCGLAISVLLERNLFKTEFISVIKKFYDPSLNSDDTEIKKIALQNIPALIEMCLGYEPENLKYIKAVNDIVIGPLYKPFILQILPDIVKVHYKYKRISAIRPTICALMMCDEKGFVVNLLKIMIKIMPKLLDKEASEEEQKKADSTMAEAFKCQILNWIKESWKATKNSKGHDLSSFIELIVQCQDLFSVLEFNDYFITELAYIIKSGSKVEKKLASNSFCQLYLKNYMPGSRSSALERILELSKSGSCYERLAALCFIEVALEFFSRKFLVQYGIIKTYLTLSEDKIANVRIKFASLAGKIAKLLIQEDHKSQLSSALALLQNDMDKDVRKLAKDAYCEYKLAIKSSPAPSADDQFKEKREEELIIREKTVFLLTFLLSCRKKNYAKKLKRKE